MPISKEWHKKKKKVKMKCTSKRHQIKVKLSTRRDIERADQKKDGLQTDIHRLFVGDVLLRNNGIKLYDFTFTT